MYHVLVLKKDVHEPGHFQYTIYYEGELFSCPRTQKGFTSYYMHFSSFKIVVTIFLVSANLNHISLLRHLPKSYFKISSFQSNFLCSSSFKPIISMGWFFKICVQNFTFSIIQYKLKRCSNKECCKQCRYVMFKGTMTKWPVQKLERDDTKTLTTSRRIKTQNLTGKLIGFHFAELLC